MPRSLSPTCRTTSVAGTASTSRARRESGGVGDGVRGGLRGAAALAASLSALVAGPALAQPATFGEVGPIVPSASPSSVREYVTLPRDLFDFGGGTTPGAALNVRWLRFELPVSIEGDLFLDIDTRVYTPGSDLVLALYDGTGNLLAVDSNDGSFPENVSAGLSFGSGGFRTPPDTPRLAGQDGPLTPGVYWLALASGGLDDVTAGTTNWNITSTQTYTLGFFGTGTTFIELSLATGNTTPLPTPSNDRCDAPLAIGENGPNDEPAWSGTSDGALNDGFSPCYFQTAEPSLQAKDIWFLYTPTVTGLVEVAVSGGNGGGASPIVTQYDVPGCFSVPVQCSGGSSFGFDGPVRIAFQATAGVPVQLALAIRAGNTGPLTLDVRPLGEPCTLVVPAGAVAESEASCGASSNDGCDAAVPGIDLITVGTPVSGTLFNGTQFRDVDWFEFTIDEESVVSVEYAAQFPSLFAIIEAPFLPGGCEGPQALRLEGQRYDRPCEITSGSVRLPAGTYRAAITNNFFDGAGCGAGYEQYWFTVSSVPCVTPVVSAPTTVAACAGEAVTINATLDVTEAEYQWQVGLALDDGTFWWLNLFEGSVLPPWFFQSNAIVTGVNTAALTVTNPDAGSAAAYRLLATVCGEGASRPIALVVDGPSCGGAGECPGCAADFDQDGGVTPADVAAFFTAFESGAACGDVDLDGGITPGDVAAFFTTFEAGGC